MIEKIDNAIIDEEGLKKNLVFSNPRLYELIKCVKNTGLEEDLTYITGISWPHAGLIQLTDEKGAGPITKPMRPRSIIPNILRVEFSKRIESIPLECIPIESKPIESIRKIQFNQFPEIFTEQLLIPDPQTNTCQQHIVMGHLSLDHKTLKFHVAEPRINIPSTAQVFIKLNCNFIRDEATKRPVYGGAYNFTVDIKTNTTDLTPVYIHDKYLIPGGAFESWFYLPRSVCRWRQGWEEEDFCGIPIQPNNI